MTERSNPRRTRAFWGNLVLMAASILLVLGLCELALRVTGFSYPAFYIYDDHLGARLRPGTEGWYRDEGEAYIRINSDGLRDHEHSIQRPPNTIRIAVLGDSYAEALQLPLELTFWGLLERELPRCSAFGGKRVEVINFGVSGYSTAQELLMLRHHAWRYSPDMVLLAFLTGNDVRDNSRRISGASPRPYFVLEGGSLVLDRSFVSSPIYKLKSSAFWVAFGRLSNNVRVFQLFNKAKNRMGQPLSAPRMERPFANRQGDEIGLDNYIYLEPSGTEWEEAWQITETLVTQMHREVSARGARFFLVTLTNPMQVHPDPEKRRKFMERLRIADLFYPDRRIHEVAKREGIQALMLGPAMQEYAQEKGTFLHGWHNNRIGGGHWNAAGHRVAATFIGNWLCSMTHR